MVIILFFFTFYLAAQFNGAGKALYVTFDLKPFVGVTIGAVVIIVYTMLGGFLAVVWTDMIQGVIMFAALIILPIAGMIELAEHGKTIGDGLAAASGGVGSWTGGATGWAAAAVIISGLSWGLGYYGQPHLVTKYMAIKDPKKMKVSRNIAFAWAIPAFTGAVFVGLVGLALYGQNHFSDVEQVMPYIANSLLPPWIAGIFISAAIAAMMSTADSQLLVISSTVIEDFYHRALGREVPRRTMLNMSRIITLVVGVMGYIIAVTSDKLIFAMVSYAWAGLGSSFGPAIILILKWKRVTKRGVLAGMLTGSISTVIWSNIEWLDDVISVRFSSFVLAFLAIVIVSLIDKKRA
jgi:sodium/proline symporter